MAIDYKTQMEVSYPNCGVVVLTFSSKEEKKAFVKLLKGAGEPIPAPEGVKKTFASTGAKHAYKVWKKAFKTKGVASTPEPEPDAPPAVVEGGWKPSEEEKKALRSLGWLRDKAEPLPLVVTVPVISWGGKVEDQEVLLKPWDYTYLQVWTSEVYYPKTSLWREVKEKENLASFQEVRNYLLKEIYQEYFITEHKSVFGELLEWAKDTLVSKDGFNLPGLLSLVRIIREIEDSGLSLYEEEASKLIKILEEEKDWETLCVDPESLKYKEEEYTVSPSYEVGYSSFEGEGHTLASFIWPNEEELQTLWEKSGAERAVPILKEAAQAAMDYAAGRPIVCLARDFLWLYALLCEKEYPCYLLPFSRLQIGDFHSVEVLVEELAEWGWTPEEVVFVDSQGAGSIYNYLREALSSQELKVAAENFVFLVCTTGDYPSILPQYTQEEIVSNVEFGLFHLVGRSKGFFQHPRWEGELVAWSSPDLPEVDNSLLMAYRIELARALGVGSWWAGVTGYTRGERTWGLSGFTPRSIHIRVPSLEAVESIKEEGYKTLRESGYSMGRDKIEVRDNLELGTLGCLIGLRYGAFEYQEGETGSSSYGYGDYILVCKSQVKVSATWTPGDSLYGHYTLGSVPALGSGTPAVNRYCEVQIHAPLMGDAFEGYIDPEGVFHKF